MRIPDCRRCGACCANPHDPEWIEVTRADLARLGDRADLVTRAPTLDWGAARPPRVMRQTRGEQRCCFLRGQVGERVSCAAYARRPAACRRVRPGSRLCCYMLGLHRAVEPWS